MRDDVVARNYGAAIRRKVGKKYSASDNSAEARASRLGGIIGSSKRSLTGSGNSSQEKLLYAQRNRSAGVDRNEQRKMEFGTNAQMQKARHSAALERRIGSRKTNSLEGGQSKRNSNFATSQRDVINKRFGGDVGKALAAMRREAARQKIAKSKGR